MKLLSWFLILHFCFSVVGCAFASDEPYEKFTVTYMDVFDTATTLVVYAKDQAQFDAFASQTHALLVRYHQIFDAYNSYDGVANLHQMNQSAALEPVTVEAPLFDLLMRLKEMQPLADNKVNAAMGTVLTLWHDARESGTSLPDQDALSAAALHCDYNDVILDAAQQTVYYTDPHLQIDLGAIAKGYAAELVANSLLTSDISSFILNLGGNVKCVGAPCDGRTKWGVGIQDPDDPNTYQDVLYISDASAVTSGDYQRFYTVDNVRYHHIIDPDSLLPASHFRAVTIVTRDALLADFLSTALFLLPYEDGIALIDAFETDIQVYWILPDGTIRMTDGMRNLLRSLGASSTD